MINALNKTRRPYGSHSPSKQILSTFTMLLVGCMAGIILKLLETLPSSYIPSFLQWLEPTSALSRFSAWIFIAVCIAVFSKSPVKASVNVFAFFAGMLAAYCIWCNIFWGGFPAVSTLTPRIIFVFSATVAAFLCWYARGFGALAVGISSVLIAVFCVSAFNLNITNFCIRHYFEMILWLASIGILFRNWRQSIYSFLISIPVAFALEYTGILNVIGIG